MKFTKHYSMDTDIQLFAPGKAESTFEKIKNSITKALAEKFGSVKSRCHIEGYSEIEISPEEIKLFFDRQDQNNADFRENWEEDLRIAGEICNGIVDKSVECSKKFLRGLADVMHEYDNIDDEFNNPNHGNVTSEPESEEQ